MRLDNSMKIRTECLNVQRKEFLVLDKIVDLETVIATCGTFDQIMVIFLSAGRRLDLRRSGITMTVVMAIAVSRTAMITTMAQALGVMVRLLVSRGMHCLDLRSFRFKGEKIIQHPQRPSSF
jgi:hypothetical protein